MKVSVEFLEPTRKEKFKRFIKKLNPIRYLKLLKAENWTGIIIWVFVNLIILHWAELIINRFKIDPLFVYGIYSVIVYGFFSYIHKKE